jgi:hypothetical protein
MIVGAQPAALLYYISLTRRASHYATGDCLSAWRDPEQQLVEAAGNDRLVKNNQGMSIGWRQ